VTSGLADLSAVRAVELPDGTMRLPDGTPFAPDAPTLPDLPPGSTAVELPDGSVRFSDNEAVLPDGTLVDPTTGQPIQAGDQAPVELTADDRAIIDDTPAAPPEPVLVGGKPADATAEVGDLGDVGAPRGQAADHVPGGTAPEGPTAQSDNGPHSPPSGGGPSGPLDGTPTGRGGTSHPAPGGVGNSPSGSVPGGHGPEVPSQGGSQLPEGPGGPAADDGLPVAPADDLPPTGQGQAPEGDQPAGGDVPDKGADGEVETPQPSNGTPEPRVNEPLAEFTPQERAEHWNHLEAVEARNVDDFDQLQRDPDKNGGISEPSKDEARVGLDLQEQGRLPDDIQRPTEANRGEFYSPSADEYYDIKGVHSDWPPFNNVRDKSMPFRGAYDPANNGRWITKLEEQIVDKGRTVILDMRNANQAAIDDVKAIVEENGWENNVVWYP
ncbi:hypothetical protein ACFS1L_22875, partial [Streptomyces chumphonensis]